MRPATARPNVRRARAAAAGRSVARVTRFAVGNGRLGRLKRGHAMWGSAADYLKKASYRCRMSPRPFYTSFSRCLMVFANLKHHQTPSLNAQLLVCGKESGNGSQISIRTNQPTRALAPTQTPRFEDRPSGKLDLGNLAVWCCHLAPSCAVA